MAKVIITLQIMPESPQTDLEAIRTQTEEAVKNFGGEVGKVEQEPVAFGLKALKIFFIMDEQKGSTEELEKKIADFQGVASVEITDVRRAVG